MKITFFKIVIILFVLFFSGNLYSQNRIYGKVYDSKSNNVLSEANIYFPDLHKGTTTNSQGKFEFKDLSSGKFSMFVSFIGYKNQIIKLQTDTAKNEIIIFLEKEAFQSEEIVVSGSRFSLQHENAIEVNSLKLSVLNQNNANLFEQIAEVPGVDIISKGGGIAKPVIRGLSNTNILFIDNGIKMENFQFSENHPFVVDEFGVERIEVIKGPASLLYGSDAVGGVLFAVREKPPHENKIETDYSLQYYDNSKGWHSSVGVKGSHNKIHAGIRASIKSHQDYIDGNNEQVPNTRFNQKSVKTVFGYLHKKGNVDIYYDYTDMQLGLCIPAAINGVSENGRENQIWYQNLSNHVVSVKNRLFFNKLKFDINAAFQSNNRTLQTSELTPQFEMVDMLMNTLSGEIKSTYSFKNSEIIFGTQNMYQTNRNADAPSHVIPNAQVFDISGFTLYTSNFSKKFHFQAGVRYDFRNIKSEIETTKQQVDETYNNMSFSTGFTYQFNQKLLLRTNFASAHRSPNIAELTQDGMHGAYYEIGDPNLKSQQNFEPDVSLHYHADKFIFEVSGFYNQINNYIFLQEIRNDTTLQIIEVLPPTFKYAQTNANIYGLETGIKFMPIDFVKIYSNYAYISAKQDNGEYLPFIPQNKINFNIKIFKENLLSLKNPFFSIKTTYAFEQSKPAIFETKTPQYFITNISVGAEKRINKNTISLSAGVNNLFNTKYIDHLSTLKGLNYYQTGRNIYANFKIAF